MPCPLRRSIPLVFCILAGAVTVVRAGPPAVLFDQGHGQRFLIEESGELHLSKLAEVFRAAGCEVFSSRGQLTFDTLEGVDVLITSGLFQPYTAEELEVILAFLERGGGLAAMLHIAPTYGNLLQSLGVLASQGVLYEGENVIGDNPLDFRVTRFASHPLFKGLEQFSVFGGWAVMEGGRDARVKTVAFTSRSSWIDADRNRQRSPREVAHSFGVAVAGQRGQGRFVVFGDDAIFQNRFLDADNQKLAHNLVVWLRPAQ